MSSKPVARLKASLTTSLAQSDILIQRLTTLLSTPAGTDTTLCAVNYILLLVHYQLKRLLIQRAKRLASIITSKTGSPDLPSPSATLTAATLPPSNLSQTTAGIKSLADTISDFRIFVRLWGLLGIYSWAKDTYLSPPRDPAIKTLVWAQVVAGFFFQVLENGAYLASKGVLRGEGWKAREGRWWILSSRCWLAHIVLEVFRLLRVRQLQFNEELGAREEKSEELKVQSEELRKGWWRQFYANAGWAPLALHWGLEEEQSPIGEGWIGVFGLLPGVIGITEAWKKTA